MKKILIGLSLLTTLAISQANSNLLDNETNTAIFTFTFKTVYKKDITMVATNKGLNVYSDSYDPTLPFILVLFGHECPPCQAELEQLKRVVSENKANVIGMECQGLGSVDGKFSLAKAKTWIRRKELNFPFGSLDVSSNIDFVKFIETQIKWDGTIPSMLLFDTKGNMKRLVQSALTKRQMNDFMKF